MDLIARPMGLAKKHPRRDGQRCAGIDASIEQARAEPLDPHETLSAREREVLQRAAEG